MGLGSKRSSPVRGAAYSTQSSFSRLASKQFLHFTPSISFFAPFFTVLFLYFTPVLTSETFANFSHLLEFPPPKKKRNKHVVCVCYYYPAAAKRKEENLLPFYLCDPLPIAKMADELETCSTGLQGVSLLDKQRPSPTPQGNLLIKILT